MHEKIDTPNGTYLVDWSLVYRVFKNHLLYQSILEKKVIKTVDHGTFLPVTKQVEVPWNEVRSSAQKNAQMAVEAWKKDSRVLPSLDNDISRWYGMTQTAKNTFRQIQESVQKDSMQAIASTVDKWGYAVDGAKLVRDTSYQTVLIGAVIVGGPAGVALAAGGSGLKGQAKFQDTGNIGAAAIEVTGSFITTVIPIAKGGIVLTGALEKASYEGVMILIGASFDTAGSLAEGDSVNRALAKTSLKIIGDQAIGKIFDLQPVKNLLNKTALPVAVRMASSTTLKDTIKLQMRMEAQELTTKSITSFAGSRVTKNITDPLAEHLTPGPSSSIKDSIIIAGKNIGETAIMKLY